MDLVQESLPNVELSGGSASPEVNVSNSGPQLIIYSPTSGLGNNMLGLASVSQLAEILNIPFSIGWLRTHSRACQASYTELFQSSTAVEVRKKAVQMFVILILLNMDLRVAGKLLFAQAKML